MIRRALALLVLSGGLVAAACGARQATTVPPRHAHAAAPAAERSVLPRDFVKAMNRFGRETWSKMSVRVASPMALALVVSMLDTGARGATRSAIAKALHVPPDSDPARWWRQWLLWTVRDRTGPRPTLDLRTRLWVGHGFAVQPMLQSLLSESYGADWAAIDLGHHEDDERQKLIGWLGRGMGGAIPEATVRLYPDEGLLLYATFGFNACWPQPFNPRDTAPGQFFPTPVLATELPMMRGTVRGYYRKTDLMQIVRIPLAARTNARWEFFIFSPYNSYQFQDAVLEPIVRSGVAATAPELKPAEIALTLPKFRLPPEFEEVQTVRFGPMRAAFSNDADLSGIAAGLKLGEILWGGSSSINELGIGQPGGCAPDSRLRAAGGRSLSRVVVTVDRGFLFAVRDAVSGVVALMGTYGLRKRRLLPL